MAASQLGWSACFTGLAQTRAAMGSGTISVLRQPLLTAANGYQ